MSELIVRCMNGPERDDLAGTVSFVERLLKDDTSANVPARANLPFYSGSVSTGDMRKRGSSLVAFSHVYIGKCSLGSGLSTIVSLSPRLKFVMSSQDDMEFAASTLVKLMNAIWNSQGVLTKKKKKKKKRFR